MSNELLADRDRFERDGYLVIRGAFSADEVEAYRSYLAERLSGNETYLETDVLRDPMLSSFVSDGRLISVTRQLLGGTPVYFGDSSANLYKEAAPVGTFHKDNTDRHDIDAPDWQGPYPLIRFGLYLQDHSRQGGGLMVRAGSHKRVARNRKVEVLGEEVFGWLSGRTRYVFTGIGDLVVWNMRLTHAGMGRFLRGPIPRPVTERTQRIIPVALQSKVAQTRYSMFASFAREGDSLDRHLRYLKTRAYMVAMWRASRVEPEDCRRFEELGAKLLDMHAEMDRAAAAGEPLGQYQKWSPLPY